MPGGDKKWDMTAERDLCLAIILGHNETEKPRHNWPKVFSFMAELGYDFTKDAISQHFTKSIMKDFKKRHGGATSSTASTPKKSTPRATPRATPRKKTPNKRKASSDEEEEDDESSGPADKKVKTEKVKREKDVKQEELDARKARERSATVMDHESKFQTWLKKEVKKE